MLLVGGVIFMVIFAFGIYWLTRPTRGNAVSRWFRSFFKGGMVQTCVHIGEDGIVRKEEMKIPYPLYLTDKEQNVAWHQVHSLAIKLEGIGRYVMVLTDSSTIPYNPFVTLSAAKLQKLNDNNAIAKEGAVTALKDAIKASRNNMIASALIICVCGVVLMFLVYIGFTMWRNGGFKI